MQDRVWSFSPRPGLPLGRSLSAHPLTHCAYARWSSGLAIAVCIVGFIISLFGHRRSKKVRFVISPCRHASHHLYTCTRSRPRAKRSHVATSSAPQPAATSTMNVEAQSADECSFRVCNRRKLCVRLEEKIPNSAACYPPIQAMSDILMYCTDKEVSECLREVDRVPHLQQALV